MAVITDSTAQQQTDASAEAKQISQKQTLNQQVQDQVSASADPSTWNKASQDESVSNVSTSGKDSLFQDQSLPASMNASADSTTAASSDPMHQYMNDLSSVLNSSSSLLGDIGNLAGSFGANPTADQQQLESAAMNTAQSVLKLDGDMLNQFSQMLKGGTGNSGGGTGGDSGGHGGGCHGHSAEPAGSDGGTSGGTNPPAGSDGGTNGGTNPPAGSDGGTNGGTNPPTGSDGGTNGGTNPPTGSDGGTNGGTNPPAGSDGGTNGGTNPPAGSDGGTNGGTNPPTGSDGGTNGGTNPPAGSDGGTNGGTNPPAGSDGGTNGGTNPPAGSDGGTNGGTNPPAGSTTNPPTDNSGGTTPRTEGTPFASDSIFNLPLGSGAQWTPNDQLSNASVYINTNGNYNENIYVGTANDPLVTVTSDGGSGGGAGTFQVHIPDGAVPAGGNDKTFTVWDQATNTWDSFGGFNWTGPNTATASQASNEPFDGSGLTQDNSNWDEGVGTLTSNDLQAGTIDHMLRVEMPFEMLHSYSSTSTNDLAPNAYPQTQEDGFAINGNGNPAYSGTVDYGVTIGIPAGTQEPTDVANNQGANMLWQALQDHGAMVRDSGGSGDEVIYQTDQNVDQSNPLVQDMEQYGNEIMSHVQILANQGPDSVNGGGTPIVPLDAPVDG